VRPQKIETTQIGSSPYQRNHSKGPFEEHVASGEFLKS